MKNDDSHTESLKTAFNELSLDDKATFLVRAAFSTAATAVDEIGQRISDLIDEITETDAETAQEAEADDEHQQE